MNKPLLNTCILVTDEEAAIREMVKLSLEEFGCRVVTASNGAEAVAQYAAHPSEINAVLLDMRMPEMDGEATIEALQWINPQVRVIASSGGGREYERRAAGLGVRQFLRKPYGVEQLLQTVAAATQNN